MWSEKCFPSILSASACDRKHPIARPFTNAAPRERALNPHRVELVHIHRLAPAVEGDQDGDSTAASAAATVMEKRRISARNIRTGRTFEKATRFRLAAFSISSMERGRSPHFAW